MKILILNNHAPSLYNFRKELINRLLSKHEIYISMPENEYCDYFRNLGCSIINTYIDRRGINPFKDIVVLFKYYNIVKKIKPDYIFTYTIKPNIYGGLISRILKIKYSANIPGLGSAFNSKSFIKNIVIFLYKISLKNANTVFFENSENEKTFINYDIITKHQAHLLNGAGVNLQEYTPLDYPNEACTNFLFIARIMKEKGINELINACKALAHDGYNFKLNILGDFEEDYRDVFAELSNFSWFTYHGYQKNILPYIQSCHCFILPSWHEGMANTNLESAACARPIITSNIHGCKEAVVHGITGYLCEKRNTESLYKVMKQFIELPLSIKKEMGIQSRKYIEKKFDKNKVVSETISILKM